VVKAIRSIVLVALFLFIHKDLLSPCIYIDKELIRASLLNKSNELLLNDVMDFIKLHEGFRHKPYNDINNNSTIGYGFVIKYIPAQYRTYISIEQADSILRNIILYNMKKVKQRYPHINYHQQLAIAHLIFRKGITSLINHRLDEMLKKDSVDDSTWIYYSSYERERIKFKENTEYELTLYKNENPY